VPRPPCRRRIGEVPVATYFKPAGAPLSGLEEVTLGLDELEALRLADLEGLYHEAAALRMGVSRQTFGRILEGARRKAAEALSLGKALRIEGGEVEMRREEKRIFQCAGCGNRWEVPYGGGRPAACPACGGTSFGRAPEDRGRARRRGRCLGRGGCGRPEAAGGA